MRPEQKAARNGLPKAGGAMEICYSAGLAFAWDAARFGQGPETGMTRRIVVIVADILSLKGTTLFTVNPDMMLSDAVLTMDEHDIGSVAVMENGKLAGMLTFREVVRMLARRQLEHRSGPTRPVAEIRVRDVMVSDPVVVTPSTEVNELRRVMVESHARYVPVMDDGVLMGILSFHDVARSVLEAQSFENRMLKAYIRDWPQDENNTQGGGL
jgi:hypothetical protein